ncbi:tRNA (guanine-N1)-methyltransferase [Aquimarina sp. MMG015]|uniref:tRNA (guanine-N1)-methyltransferase n=1 Tax=Aquimarina sp. MMG015 TaxID=2822689 RepID=UPI001B3A2566|nr:tRNA (guanine-N1)-methyltransferase [Aquimarina sp. MMG015]MBQ4804829.1 tRNA (guanine-N1)-methyltransferase [Aquimarina sp. MMG015]
MKLPKYLLVFIALFPIFETIQAQEDNLTAEQALKNENIKTQFDVVIKKSGKYQEYKVVKRVWLDKLKGNTIDSLKTLEDKLNSSNQKITEQLTSISNLEASLAKTNENLTTVTEEKDSMTFLGIPFTKGSYKTMMWTIVGALVALLAFFVFKFKNSNSVTVQAKKALAETEAEFEDHRRRALEREQKVMRKLQDEINKQRKTGAK